MKLFKFPQLNVWSASVDLIIVILGILIAFALNSSWQNGLDKKKERDYLQRLEKDFTISLAELDSVWNVQAQYRDNMIKVLDIIHYKKEYDVDDLKSWMITGHVTYEIEITDGTYNSLISSGNLYLISDDSLNNSLASFGSRLTKWSAEIGRESDNLYNLTLTPFYLEEIGGVISFSTDERNKRRNLPLTNAYPIRINIKKTYFC